MIKISSQTYQIIVYNTSLTVAPMNGPDKLLCPQHLVNTSLNLSPFHTAWNTKNITLYYDCPTNANQSIGLSNHQFDCIMNGTNTVGYFVVTYANLSAAAKDALRSCHSSVLLPAFASILQVLEHNPSAAYLKVALANGFALQWNENVSLSGMITNRARNTLIICTGVFFVCRIKVNMWIISV